MFESQISDADVQTVYYSFFKPEEDIHPSTGEKKKDTYLSIYVFESKISVLGFGTKLAFKRTEEILNDLLDVLYLTGFEKVFERHMKNIFTIDSDFDY